MAKHVPQRKPLPLPDVGKAIERPVMDWKRREVAFKRDDKAPYERAKDVAAFANHLGGTILIGADEKDGQLDAYRGLDPADAGKLRDDYSKAVKDLCEPKPAIDFEEYDDPSGATKRVVAVNVEPSLNLVGVRIKGDTAKGYGGDAYVYPVRSGTDCIYLQPGQLAMFMTPQTRRVAVMLSRIGSLEDVLVRFVGGQVLEDAKSAGSPFALPEPQLEGQFINIDEQMNEIVLMIGRGAATYPLDRVLSVYKHDRWIILIDRI